MTPGNASATATSTATSDYRPGAVGGPVLSYELLRTRIFSGSAVPFTIETLLSIA